MRYGIGTGMNKRAPLGGKFGFGQVDAKKRRLTETTIQMVLDFHSKLNDRLSNQKPMIKAEKLPSSFTGVPSSDEEYDDSALKWARKHKYNSGQQREEKTREQLEQEQKAAEEAVKGLPPDQIFVLQNYFNDKSMSPKEDDIRYLSKALYLDKSVVKEWFFQARKKLRESEKLENDKRVKENSKK